MPNEPATPEAAKHGWTDQRVEQIMGNLLRAGVIIAAAIVLVGGIVFLVHHGHEEVHYGKFQGEPPELRRMPEIVGLAKTFSGRGLIQLGMLALVGTPLARVVFSVFAFGRQRDWMYVAITLIVLTVLLYSLIWDSGS